MDKFAEGLAGAIEDYPPSSFTGRFIIFFYCLLNYDTANKGIMTLCRLSWLEPCKIKLKNEYGGSTLNDWGMYDDRASWFKDINDQIRHFIPINPRPRFIKNQKGSDNVTVAWLVIDKRFSWIDQGIISPFQFITGWKK
jgi:hypothetical protein